MLAMVSRECHELVEDPLLLAVTGGIEARKYGGVV